MLHWRFVSRRAGEGPPPMTCRGKLKAANHLRDWRLRSQSWVAGLRPPRRCTFEARHYFRQAVRTGPEEYVAPRQKLWVARAAGSDALCGISNCASAGRIAVKPCAFGAPLRGLGLDRDTPGRGSAYMPSMARSVVAGDGPGAGSRLLWRGARKRPSFRQVASNPVCSASDWPWDSNGPPSPPIRLRTTWAIGCRRKPRSICNRRITSPPSSQRLSRCRRKVLGEICASSRERRNGVKHATICRPGVRSHGSYAQLLGH